MLECHHLLSQINPLFPNKKKIYIFVMCYGNNYISLYPKCNVIGNKNQPSQSSLYIS